MKREDVRRAVIAALAADDILGELLVLKGGNALSLVHRIGNRATLDVDYSIEESLDDPSVIRTLIERALGAEFLRHGFRVLDVKMKQAPELRSGVDLHPKWGGWSVEFKLVTPEIQKRFSHRPEKIRQMAQSLTGDKKAFQIDISKFEFVQEAKPVQFEGYELRVYSVAMLVYEKLRALCQQLPDYTLTHRRPRPRDFVDICAVLETREQEVLQEHHLLGKMFAAKDVPVSLLLRLSEQQTFHQQGWEEVQAQLPNAGTFLSYFERVLALVKQLEALGVVKPPSR